MNVTITPKMNEYRWVDVLSCNAIGNPSPSYTWRRAHKTIANGPKLSLTEAGLKANRLQTIECIAQNQVSAQIKQSSAEIDLLISGNEFNIGFYQDKLCQRRIPTCRGHWGTAPPKFEVGDGPFCRPSIF